MAVRLNDLYCENYKSSLNDSALCNIKKNDLALCNIKKNDINNINFKKTINNDRFSYSKDDGIISTKNKLRNFGKGLISPITEMFSSPENFITGAAIITGGAVLTTATGGAALPFLVALGVTTGGIQFVKSAYNAANAQTDKEAKEAWQGIGQGVSSLGLSASFAKTSLKASGTGTEGLNTLNATINVFKEVPNSLKNSLKAFTSGEFKSNLGFKSKHYKEYTIIRELSEDELPPDIKAELIKKGLL